MRSVIQGSKGSSELKKLRKSLIPRERAFNISKVHQLKHIDLLNAVFINYELFKFSFYF